MTRRLRRTLAGPPMALLLLLSCSAPQPEGPALEFAGGRWFDGAGFQERTAWAVAGNLSFRRPGRVDSVIDISGGWVVPAFGEAHNHNVESSRFDQVNRAYIEAGIFYVKNPNSLASFTEPIRERVAQPHTIDATFAGGGLTSTGGHPIEIADRMIGYGVWKPEDGDGGFYWIIDDRDDLDARWQAYLDSGPEFVKAYLLYSEDHAERAADSTTFGWRGLDPELMPEIVERAHAAGLTVTAHVETAADFRTAVAADVDEINHLPGFRPDEDVPIDRYRITDEDAGAAAARDIVVVTTVGATITSLDRLVTEVGADKVAPYRELVAHNLRVLSDNGVRIAIGSDSYERTSQHEAVALSTIDVFSNLELLRMWAETTPQAIFPHRRIGKLEEGWEANFLVLEADPTESFENVTRIRLRVKQGEPLEVPPAPEG